MGHLAIYTGQEWKAGPEMAVRTGPEFTPSLIEKRLSSHGMVASPNWIGSGGGTTPVHGSLLSRWPQLTWEREAFFQTWCGVPTVTAKVLYGPSQPLPVPVSRPTELQTERVRGVMPVPQDNASHTECSRS